jgi:hypothetical protein
MSKGNFTATDASTKIITGSIYRGCLVIQKTNATAIALGIGEAAVAGEGIQLTNKNDSIVLRGADAIKDIYAIGNGGTGTYQDGDCMEYVPGPYVSA